MDDEQPTVLVHWIQARKALEDSECWEPVVILDVDGRQAAVQTQDGTIIRLQCGIPLRALEGAAARLCLRWAVLAVSSRSTDQGNSAIGISPEFDSLFGEPKMQFVHARKIGDTEQLKGPAS